MVPPGNVVVHKGDKADSMCFIASGTVAVEVPPEPHILGPGDFFSILDALRISEIANLLEVRVVPPGNVVVHKGDKADSMCFIASGTVAVEVPPEPHILGPGDFFGEIALLKDCERTATVTTVTECQFMVLSVEEFQRLLKTNPEIQEAITHIMEDRLAELESTSPIT